LGGGQKLQVAIHVEREWGANVKKPRHDEHNHEGKEHTHLFLIFQVLLSPNEEGICIRCAPRVVRI
jgi:hypothetical protein